MTALWDLPGTWAWTTMSEIAQIVGGGTPRTSDPGNFSGEIPWITPADLTGYGAKTISRGARYISQRGFEESGATWLPKGSVLFSSRAPIGYVAVAACPVTTNQGFKSFIPEAGINSDYLYYWLSTAKEEAEALASGTTFLEISGKKAAKIRFPLPPTNEQARIAKRLEELLSDLDAGISELKKARGKLIQHRLSLLKAGVEGDLTAQWRQKSQVTETGANLLDRVLANRRARWEAKQILMFEERGKAPPKNWQEKYVDPVMLDTDSLPKLPEEWVWANINQLAEVFLGKMLDKSKHKAGTKIPYLRNVNVRWGSIDSDDLYEMFFEEDELERYGIIAGDVLVCEGGEPGRAAICGKEHEGLKYQKALHRVRMFGFLEPEFLVAYLEYIAKTGQLAKTFTGSTISHLTKESFLELKVPLPSLSEQRMIVSEMRRVLDNISLQEKAIDISLKQSMAQRKNILRAGFSGKLVPQEKEDGSATEVLDAIKAHRADREGADTPRIRKNKSEKDIRLMLQLMEVLTASEDWIPTKDAFIQCGVKDGMDIDRIEQIYEQIRQLDKDGVLETRSKGDLHEIKMKREAKHEIS